MNDSDNGNFDGNQNINLNNPNLLNVNQAQYGQNDLDDHEMQGQANQGQKRQKLTDFYKKKCSSNCSSNNSRT